MVWATAQYLSYAEPPSIMDVDVTIAVAGRQTTQARAVGHVGNREILTVNAALGSRPLDAEAQWTRRPDVPPPDEDDEDRYHSTRIQDVSISSYQGIANLYRQAQQAGIVFVFSAGNGGGDQIGDDHARSSFGARQSSSRGVR